MSWILPVTTATDPGVTYGDLREGQAPRHSPPELVIQSKMHTDLCRVTAEAISGSRNLVGSLRGYCAFAVENRCILGEKKYVISRLLE